VLYLLLASVLTGSLPDALAALVAFTALFAGAARYAAVLTDRDETEIERATAIGFFLGGSVGLLILFRDWLT
jgi:hypothetical protein